MYKVVESVSCLCFYVQINGERLPRCTDRILHRRGFLKSYYRESCDNQSSNVLEQSKQYPNHNEKVWPAD